ncbi:MAG: hypothetical protein OXI16_02015 [Chloroflexota bacterium]|nr:hypothetical protein [Chloroflexota bacterium]
MTIKKRKGAESPKKPNVVTLDGVEILTANSWVHKAFEKYGEPTMSRDELRAMMDKELDGESLSDFLIQDRKKNPY